MSTGLLNSLMNAQSQTVTPSGQQMQVVMIPSRNIIPNPDNDEIYTIGNMDGLKDDILQHGLRQPLEVIPVEGEPNRYMLISGHRRWAACGILSACGESRFDALPCLIRESHGKLDDRIALITANATARDLTDGERLAQYEALKDALTKKKAAGQLEGKVRDEVCRILGLSTGAAARLNVIAFCENEVIKERLKAGEIGLMEAYRSAQDYARFMGAAPEEPEQKEEPAETIPVNQDYAEWKLPPEAIAMVEKAHEEQRKVQTDAPKPAVSKSVTLPSVYSGEKCDYSASHLCENEAGLKHFIKHGEIHGCAGCCRDCKNKDTCEYSCVYASKGKETQEQPKEQPRGRDTLHKLAEKTLGANAAWELEWEDVRFRLAYYKQPLPGGATLWKRIDTTREDAGQTCDDYAIILQDNSFFTCGWISFYSGITDILTDYFELK
ncbi:MAG: ParB N-terminal domain-containing protein [Faecalibacterium prausnitzii]|nr:ParB N-terminal domain-containing protein [Faecalibacterium prausnitzii]